MTSADVLRFSSGSADVAPGASKSKNDTGLSESVADPAAYAALRARPHWRRVLSNFHIAPFRFRGHTYNSIEHAFQGTKIALQDPARAMEFTLESRTPLGCGTGFDARGSRKMVILTKNNQEKWNAMSRAVMAEAAEAKYAQCPEAAAVLLDTRDAELWHVGPRMKPDRFTHLERIRAAMQSVN